jgi:hypothetical protein
MDPQHRRVAPWVAAAALFTGGVIGGGVLAGTLSASAAGNTAGSSTTSSTAAASTAPPAGPARSSSPVRSDEKAVSASMAATLRAAALKAVPGGSVYRIETDAGDAAYEAHMTKADGRLVTVKFDKNLKVTKVESGMGQGDPALPGQGAPPTSG